MNLSDASMDHIYADAAIDLDGDGSNFIKATSISHALTIPFSAKEPGGAKQFAELFLQIDFPNEGFLKRQQAVGKWA